MQRSTRRLTLTEAGSNLYARCAEQVEALTDATQDVRDGSQLIAGTVRVAAPADFFRWFPVSGMAEFLEKYPDVRLEFVLSDDRADLIGQGIDIAVRSGRELESNLVARKIGTSQATLVASPKYLAARGTPDNVAALSSHDCLGPPHLSGHSVWRLDGPEGPQEVEVDGRFHANTMQVLLDAAVAGLGIALLPVDASTPHIRNGELVEVLPGHGVTGAGVYIVYLSRRQMPRAIGAFIEFAVKRLVDRGIVLPLPGAAAPER
jgi:LysR family transcriptional regulator AphB